MNANGDADGGSCGGVGRRANGESGDGSSGGGKEMTVCLAEAKGCVAVCMLLSLWATQLRAAELCTVFGCRSDGVTGADGEGRNSLS